MSNPKVRYVRTDHLLGVYKPGSCGSGWLWEDEYGHLISGIGNLVDDIRENGIREPILLGDDGRVWDGHHRVVAAMEIGLYSVPVVFSGDV